MKTLSDKTYPFTAEDIRQYLEGKMPASEALAFEKAMRQDPFLADAVEGFRSYGGWAELEAVRQNVSTRTSPANPWWKMALGGTTLISALAILGWYFLLIPGENSEISQPAPMAEVEEFIPPKAEVGWSYATDSGVTMNVYIAEEQQALEQPAEKYVRPIYTEEIDNLNELRRKELAEIYMLERIPAKALDAASDTLMEAPRLPSGNIYHVLNYKLADYRGKRMNFHRPTSEPILGGTPASEVYTEELDQALPATQQVPYVKYLEEAVRHYARSQYGNCLEMMDIILKQYPDDVNAQFYGGMCAFYLKRYELAETMLRQVSYNKVTVFTEEASFYRARVLLELGDHNTAAQMFRKIADQGGFYATQAAKRLELSK